MHRYWFRQTCEYLGGARDDAPKTLPFGVGSPAWGLWWAVLLVVIALFCGQSSKFIYIDF